MKKTIATLFSLIALAVIAATVNTDTPGGNLTQGFTIPSTGSYSDVISNSGTIVNNGSITGGGTISLSGTISTNTLSVNGPTYLQNAFIGNSIFDGLGNLTINNTLSVSGTALIGPHTVAGLPTATVSAGYAGSVGSLATVTDSSVSYSGTTRGAALTGGGHGTALVICISLSSTTAAWVAP